MTVGIQGHPAQFSAEVVDILERLLAEHPDDGGGYDPFAGAGQHLERLGLTGGELEPEWAALSDRVQVADALAASSYPPSLGRIVTSPVYGNRMADTYLGKKCGTCKGTGNDPSSNSGLYLSPPEQCPDCLGLGVDLEDQESRRTYSTWLRRAPSEGSSNEMSFWNGHKGELYRHFHMQWLLVIARILPRGNARLVLNMKDHYRTEHGARRRQYAVRWWLKAADFAGFKLAHIEPAYTRGHGYGAGLARGDEKLAEYVIVFDLPQ